MKTRTFGNYIGIVSLFLGLTLAVVAYLRTVNAEGRSIPNEFESLPHDVQLIPKLEVKLPNGVEKMVMWPSSKYIEEHYAKDDISDQLPPIYPERVMEDAKPIRPGGVSPKAAIEEAELWLRQILKPEWIPPDLVERLIPLRSDTAQWSTVICRYETQGHVIQISQTRWAISVVLKPPLEDIINEKEKFGATVFEKFFTKGKEMSALKGQQVSLPSERQVTFYLLDVTRLPSTDAIENWWGWTAWYTDSHSIAVFLRKRIAGEQHTPTPEDPWF